MRNLLLCFMLLFSLSLLTNCGNDDEMEASVTCTDGIQNGDETGIDCGGSCTTCETTVEEDKDNVDQTLDNLVSCSEDVKNGRSVTEIFENFLNMTDGETLNEDWVNDIYAELEEVFDFAKIDESMTFDVGYHAGTHTYNISTGTWTKANNVTDKVVFNFPTSPDATVNNAEFVMDTYIDETVTIDGETMSLPKTMHAVLNIDNAKAVELTLSNITYATNAGFQIPVEVSASLFVDPMNVNVEISRMSDTAFDMSMSFDNDNICDVELASQIELKNDDFENFEMSSFEKANIQVNLGQLSFRTMGDLASLLAMEEPTDSQINSMADFDVFFSDMKIGDIEINDEMETILILYKDSSKENMDSFFERMGTILEDIFG